MTIIDILLKIIPGNVLEQIRFSRFGGFAVKYYSQSHKNSKLSTYTIFKNILIEADTSKRSERAIPINAYEPKITKKFLELIKEGDTVFDVGAWIGYYTILAANKVKSLGKVVAIDPSKENISRIKNNMKLNNFTNIEILECGVGEKHGQANIKEQRPSTSSTFQISSVGDNPIKIEKIDDIVKNIKISKIDLLIMDIEGYEYHALMGMSNLLSNNLIKNMIIEIHVDSIKQFGHSDKDLIKLLKDSHYDISIIEKKENHPHYHILATSVKS